MSKVTSFKMQSKSSKKLTIRNCVFCGKTPEKKTKEHVLPQWLIKLTGNPKRVVPLIFKKKQLKLIKAPFDSFSFPACKICNELYSNMEDRVCSIVNCILNNSYLSEEDFSLFLDWLDKVRIGLWLGERIVNNEVAMVNPKFHINNRLGIKDRLVILLKASDDRKGLQVGGIQVPNFHFTPSCFSLTINNLFIINISYDLLFSRRLGFPFLKNSFFDIEIGDTRGNIVPGNHRLMLPILKSRIELSHKAFFQPGFSSIIKFNPEAIPFYETDYVVSNTFSKVKGLGKIFTEEGNLFFPEPTPKNLSLNNLPKFERKLLERTINCFVLDFQMYLNTLFPTFQHLSKEKRRDIRRTMRKCDQFNKRLIKLIQEST